MRSLFVFNNVDLNSQVPGGVQRCTHEFFQVVRAASDFTSTFLVDYDRSLIARLKRRSRLFPYIQYNEHLIYKFISQEIKANNIDTVFFNRAELCRLAKMISTSGLCVQTIVMSHGNESGDLVYEIAVNRKLTHRNLFKRFYDFLWLGGDIVAEAQIRHQSSFKVVAMSEEEAVIERWLGAKDVLVMPRTINFSPLDWQPRTRTVGWVGSLHHTPNIVALTSILECLESSHVDVSFEVVGHPESIGKELSKRFPFVIYHGALDTSDLKRVMSHWSLFINPIFWLSKGASMKLADALGAGLPVLSTKLGRRGYDLPEELVFISENNAQSFASMLDRLLACPELLRAKHENLLSSADQLTTVESLACRLRHYALDRPLDSSVNDIPIYS